MVKRARGLMLSMHLLQQRSTPRYRLAKMIHNAPHPLRLLFPSQLSGNKGYRGPGYFNKDN